MRAAHAIATDARPSFLDVADAIGCRIVRDAIRSGDRCTWMVWTKEPYGAAFPAVLRTAPVGLHLGVAGIALFLAHLGRFTGDPLQRRTAEAALRQVAALLAENSADLGFYSGASGAAWVLIAASDLFGSSQWREVGLTTLRRIAETAPETGMRDLLGGQAGVLAVLSAVGADYGDAAMLDAAERLGDSLVAAATWHGRTANWPSGTPESQPLLGLSHGTTGILLALLELHHLRPKPSYPDVALAALAHERARFDAAHGNWPDYRLMPGAPPTPPHFPVAWCHGSTGMGLARLRLLDLLPDDPHLLSEIDVARANAVTAINLPLDPLTTDVTYCHGLLGNSELLLEIGDRFDRADALAGVRTVGALLTDLWHPTMPWQSGVHGCGESPSLMTGTAGIGLHFLRLFDRSGIATVLLPPRAAATPRTGPLAANET